MRKAAGKNTCRFPGVSGRPDHGIRGLSANTMQDGLSEFGIGVADDNDKVTVRFGCGKKQRLPECAGFGLTQ